MNSSSSHEFHFTRVLLSSDEEHMEEDLKSGTCTSGAGERWHITFLWHVGCFGIFANRWCHFRNPVPEGKYTRWTRTNNRLLRQHIYLWSVSSYPANNTIGWDCSSHQDASIASNLCPQNSGMSMTSHYWLDLEPTTYVKAGIIPLPNLSDMLTQPSGVP